MLSSFGHGGGQHVETAQTWHIDVQEGQIRLFIADNRECRGTITTAGYDLEVAGLTKESFQPVEYNRVVISEKDRLHKCAPSSSQFDADHLLRPISRNRVLMMRAYLTGTWAASDEGHGREIQLPTDQFLTCELPYGAQKFTLEL